MARRNLALRGHRRGDEGQTTDEGSATKGRGLPTWRDAAVQPRLNGAGW